MRYVLVVHFALIALSAPAQTPQTSGTRLEQFPDSPFHRTESGSGLAPNSTPKLFPQGAVEPPLTSIERDPEPGRNRLAFDLLIGLPTGVRAQYLLGDSRWMLESVIGFVPFPGGGIGLRRNSLVVGNDQTGYYINPGIGFYAMHIKTSGFLFGNNDFGYGYVALDADFLLKNRTFKHCTFDFGVKLGVGIGGGGNSDNSVGVLPIFSFILGCHF